MSAEDVDAHWRAAARRFGLSGDEVYDDDDATFFAEERMREAVLGALSRSPAPRRRNWWNRPAVRLLQDEMMLAFEATLEAMLTKRKPKRPPKR